MRKRKLLVFLLIVLGAEAVVALRVVPRSNRVTWLNYYRIEEGMRRTDAQAILGGPPGIYATGLLPGEMGLEHSTLESPAWSVGTPDTAECWIGDNVGVFLTFDRNGRVVGKWLAHHRTDNSLW
jgi:hypothetical protein